MKVIILAGGQGTRIREETHSRPKPMLDIGERPLLWHIMKTYSHYGHKDFVVCLGYLGHVVREWFFNYDYHTKDATVALGSSKTIEYHELPNEDHFRVTLAETGLRTMTGGRVARAARFLGEEDETFLVTYGDGLSDIDITKLVEFHKSHGRIGTVSAVRPLSRYGILDVNDNGAVKKFIEKPRLDGWINAGYFVFDKRFLNYLGDENCVLEREPLERLAADGELMAFKHDGFFYAMDTFREYQELNEMWNAGDAPWRVWN